MGNDKSPCDCLSPAFLDLNWREQDESLIDLNGPGGRFRSLKSIESGPENLVNSLEDLI